MPFVLPLPCLLDLYTTNMVSPPAMNLARSSQLSFFPLGASRTVRAPGCIPRVIQSQSLEAMDAGVLHFGAACRFTPAVALSQLLATRSRLSPITVSARQCSMPKMAPLTAVSYKCESLACRNWRPLMRRPLSTASIDATCTFWAKSPMTVPDSAEESFAPNVSKPTRRQQGKFVSYKASTLTLSDTAITHVRASSGRAALGTSSKRAGRQSSNRDMIGKVRTRAASSSLSRPRKGECPHSLEGPPPPPGPGGLRPRLSLTLSVS